ncbi:hypothetical protein NT6N_28960 [Oceaniferula spumae]|uniref:Cysteine dioxygenase n=1 Tax=Oceaniferula spumae TaxID=2979115 RepID=A0AAT9FPA3_9BACT
MDDYNRRHFIRTSLPGFLGLGLALPSITALATRANAFQGRVPENGAINWDAFLTAVEKEAAKQHLDHWDQAAYVKQAAALALRLNLKDPALAKAFENTKKGLGNKRTDFYKLEKQRNFEVSLVQFEKGEQISHHDHPGMTGVLLCATGNVDVWNYDLLGEKKGSKNVLLAETAQSTLSKGMVSTLTSKERNIHRLKAHSLTQLVDIFAPPYNKERAQKSTWFSVDPEPYQGRQKIHEATRR